MKRTLLERRTPLRARKPLERTGGLTRSPMKRKRARRVERKTDEEREFTAWIHTQPCVGRATVPGHVCRGRIQQAHARNLNGVTGLGLKENDLCSVAACELLHVEYDEHRGVFKGWSRDQRRVWMWSRIIETRARFEAAAARRAKG